MLNLLSRCFPDRWDGWQPQLKTMIPASGAEMAADPELAAETFSRTDQALNLG